jgi:phosphate transport system substrate-binding protein
MTMRISSRVLAVLSLVALAAIVAAGCGGDGRDDESTSTAAGGETTSAAGGEDLSGSISIDGSSTVGPLVTAAAEQFQEANSGVNVTVGVSGTGGGFERFCAGETDLSNASRPIEDDEIALCKDGGVEYTEFQVANDGLAVVVNPENDWAECLTVEQLKTIWSPDTAAKSWKDVDPSFPDEQIKLYGPGTDSGTFDYFTDVINGEEGSSRTDYQATEDDNVIVQGVGAEKGGLGYFGLSYAEQNSDEVKLVPIDSGGGCITPSVETVQDETYKPLGRPLYVYAKKAALARPEVTAFMQFMIDNAVSIAEESLFVPMTEAQVTEAKSLLEAAA